MSKVLRLGEEVFRGLMLHHQALMCPAPHILPARYRAWDLLFASPPLLAPSPLLIGFLAGVPKQDKQEKLAWSGGTSVSTWLLGFEEGGFWATLWDVEASGVTSRKLSPCLLFESLCLQGLSLLQETCPLRPRVERFQQGTILEGQISFVVWIIISRRKKR